MSLTSELKVAANVGRDFANIYVNEALENIEKTVMTLYFLDKGDRFKHYEFVLAGNRTRMTVEQLGAGKYVCEATQYAGEEKLTAEIEFEVPEFIGVDTGLDLSEISLR